MRYSSIRVEIKFTTTTTTTTTPNTVVALSRNAEIYVSCHTVFEHRWRNALMPLPVNIFNRLRLLYSSMIMKIIMIILTTDKIKALSLRLLHKSFSSLFLC